MRTFLHNYLLKIIIAFVLIATTVISFIVFYNVKKPSEEISINIVLIDIDNNVISDKKHKVINENLYDVLKNNYEIRTKEGAYGIVIYDIDEIKTDFKTTYIAIYIDDKYSNLGISSIKLYDNIKISFRKEKVWT